MIKIADQLDLTPNRLDTLNYQSEDQDMTSIQKKKKKECLGYDTDDMIEYHRCGTDGREVIRRRLRSGTGGDGGSVAAICRSEEYHSL